MGLLLLLFIAIVLLWLLAAAGLVYALSHPKRKTFAVALAKGDPTDPADLELDAQEVTFTLTDGSRSPGWVIQGNDAQGPTVVIVHGYGDSRYGSLTRAPLVVPTAKRVVVFDLPGQGESESRRGYGGLREPDDVLAVVGQLEKQDAQRVVLLGVSMGAGITIAAAAKATKETVSDTVLDTDTVSDIRGGIVGVIAEGPYRHWDEPLHNVFRKHRYPRWPIIPLAGLWLGLTARGFRDFDRAGYASKLTCPLLVIHGSEDTLCPITSAREIAEAAAVGEFIEIDGGGHDDLSCNHEQAYRDAVGDFLKRLCDRGGSGTM
jgi:uncharacterized protein